MLSEMDKFIKKESRIGCKRLGVGKENREFLFTGY